MQKRKQEQFLPVQVLDPLRIDITIKDNPVTFTTLTMNVVDDLTQSVNEETVVPLTSSGVKSTIERVLVHSLGVNDIRDALHSVETFQRSQEDLPRITLATAGGPNHHDTVLNLLDLVELQNLVDPALALDQATLSANFANLLAKGVQVDGNVVDAREYIR